MRGRRATRCATAALVGATLLAGCSGTIRVGSPASATAGGPTISATGAVSRSPASTLPTATAAGASPTESPTQPDGRPELTLAFGGDIHFTDYVAGLLDDPASSMASLRETLGSADLAMVNLETAITTRGTPMPKQFHFRTTPDALSALRSVGVDAVTMANNHGADYGSVGLRDTLAAKAGSPIPVVGIGADADEAFAAATVDVKGVRVALIGATQIPDYTAANFAAGPDKAGVATALNTRRLVSAVKDAAAGHDLVVVYLHWGVDYTRCPSAFQESTAKALRAAGADVIVGAHAHRLQGAGWYGRAYVGYGLGNFVWWRSREPDSTTGVLTLTVDADAAIKRGRATGADRLTARSLVTAERWTPMLITRTGAPAVQTGTTGERMLAAWTRSRGCTNLSPQP